MKMSGVAGAPVQAIFDGMLERIFVGLPNACVSLDDDATATMAAAMGEVHAAIVLVEKPGQCEE
jgi:hypothetical protein